MKYMILCVSGNQICFQVCRWIARWKTSFTPLIVASSPSVDCR